MKDAFTVFLIGFGVVFVGLLCLIGIIYIMSAIVRLVRREDIPRKKRIKQHDDFVPIADSPAVSVPAPRKQLLLGPDRRAAVAAISAAVAEYMGTDVEGIRIRSIRLAGEPSEASDRRELIAAISAAIATELDTDISGIRIHSIKIVNN